MASRREQRRADWEAAGGAEAQARLRAALAAAGVDMVPLRAVVGGGEGQHKLHATVNVIGEELDQLIAALERAALPQGSGGPS